MLEELIIRNYALIDNVSIKFEKGFNVLTGETGAGKSILIDALSLVLGGKAKNDAIRTGCDQAEVTAVFSAPETSELLEWIDKYGIKPEDGAFILRRIIRRNGRGSISVQSVPVTIQVISELSQLLADIHGQHEHQSLFNIKNHRVFLDRFAGLEERVKNYFQIFTELSEIGKRIELLLQEKENSEREKEFLEFAVEELENAALKEGEEEELIEQQKRLSGFEELSKELDLSLNQVLESRSGALLQLRSAVSNLKKASEIDSGFNYLHGRLDSLFYDLEDIAEEIRSKRDKMEFDPFELETTDERLALISRLEKKYACNSVSGLNSYLEDIKVKLENLNSRDDELNILSEKKEILFKKVMEEASDISAARQNAARELQKRIEKHLQSLGMKNAVFTVSLEGRKNQDGKNVVGPYGMDSVEFKLSANPGEKPKPLKSVASGGELSRVMLAVKTVLSETDIVNTMVFDEIDTGIGGEVARSVGEHMYGLSANKQVFCITHLASIAIFADNHLQVNKITDGEKTFVQVITVDGESRIREIARMLAGSSDSKASIEHAARLLEERSTDVL